jgi:hypothetical protein
LGTTSGVESSSRVLTVSWVGGSGTDKAAVYPPVLDEIAAGAWHHTEPLRQQPDRSRSWPVEVPAAVDARPETTPLCTGVISTGHAFVRNLRSGHYELGTEKPTTLRVAAAVDELTLAIWPTGINDLAPASHNATAPDFLRTEQAREHWSVARLLGVGSSGSV